MQQAGWTGLALALGVLGWAGAAGAQVQPPPPAAVAPVVASGYEPAPVASHPLGAPDSTISGQPAAGNTPIAPGSARLRINGRLTTYVGAASDSGRR